MKIVTKIKSNKKKIIMKKYGMATVVAGLISFGAAAQSNNVISANNYLKNGELEKALEKIEMAKEHEKTSDKGKTWLYRGQIMMSIAKSEEENYQMLVEDPLFEASKSFKKAIEIGDRRVDEREVKQLYQVAGIEMFKSALDHYNASEFPQASTNFERSAEIKEYFEIIDTSAYFNAGLAAEYGGDTARALTFYKKVAEWGYLEGELYGNMAQLLLQQGKDEEAMTVLAEGRRLYPTDQNIIATLINIYLKEGKSEEALEMINEALKADDVNAQLLFAKGTLLDELGKPEESMKVYKKAVAVDPDNYESYYNLGAIFVNQASDIQSKMNELDFKQQDKYEKLKKERNELFKKALEPLEKAHKLNEEDITTVQTLAQIYGQLEMREKYKAMSEKLSTLRGK